MCTVQVFFETWFVQNSDNVVISWHVMCYIINREATKIPVFNLFVLRSVSHWQTRTKVGLDSLNME